MEALEAPRGVGRRWGRRDFGSSLPRLHRQPPVRSPLPPAAILGAALDLVRRGNGDARARLIEVLEREYSADEVILCDTGTSALALAIRGVRERTRHAGPLGLPAFSCFDVGAAAVGAAVPLVFYDLDPETLAPDLGSFLAALRRGARCIVVSHLYGIPVDWAPLQDAADAFGAVLIEDAAQGHGAYLGGRRLGTLGPVAVLSFGRGKGWTGGRGGAVLVRGLGGPLFEGGPPVKPSGWTEEAAVLVSAAAHAILSHPSRYWLPAAVPFLHLGQSTYRAPGGPRVMTRLATGIARRTRPWAVDAAEGRRRVASWLSDTIQFTERVRPVRPAQPSLPGYLRFPVLLDAGLAGFRSSAAARRLGIESSYPLILPELVPLRDRLASPVGCFPGARALTEGLVTLPTHSGLSFGEMQQVLELLEGYGKHGPAPSSTRSERVEPSSPSSRHPT